jgi:glycosyltransferase involved in cell wall biosynthesis
VAESVSVAPVSVVIPFYNGHAWIDRAIRSIENQTLQPAEIVVVDDGSSAPFVPPDCSIPIRHIRHDSNRGIPSARNTGVRTATQEWIAFLDQDDEWLPRKLELQWDVVSRLPASERSILVYGRAVRLNESGRELNWPRESLVTQLNHAPHRALRCLLERGNVIPFITILVPRRVLLTVGGFDTDLTGGSDDYALLIRLASAGIEFASPENGVIARRHETGYNYSRADRLLRDDLAILEKIRIEQPELSRSIATGKSNAYYRAARAMLIEDTASSRVNIRNALRLRPASPRTVLTGIAAYCPRAIQKAFNDGWDFLRYARYRH